LVLHLYDDKYIYYTFTTYISHLTTASFKLLIFSVCNFVVGLYFLELVNKFGVGGVYFTFGGVSLLIATFAYYFIVDTKGRSLEQIEMSLTKRS
jgi:Sugar (and other) transporter